MMTTEPTLLVDSGFGRYIPQIFATRYLTTAVCQRCGIDEEDARILGLGPADGIFSEDGADSVDPELYDEAWAAVLDRYSAEDGATLWQDGDLWLVPVDFDLEENGWCI